MPSLTKTLALSLLAATALAAAPAHAFGGKKPEDFVARASMNNLYKLEISRLALDRAQHADVKAFAQREVADQTAAGEALKDAATAAGLQASLATTLDAKHQKEVQELQTENVADFDEEYLDERDDAQRKTTKLLKKFSEKGEQADLKAFAAQALPAAEQRRAEIKALEDKIDALN